MVTAGQGLIQDDMNAIAEAGQTISFTAPGAHEALETLVVMGNSMLPLYRHGDTLLISASAPMKVGDRVIARDRDQRILGGTLFHLDQSHAVICQGGMSRKEVRLAIDDMSSLARVIWASQ